MPRFLHKLFTLKLEAATKKLPSLDSRSVLCLSCGHPEGFHNWNQKPEPCRKIILPYGAKGLEEGAKCDCPLFVSPELTLEAATKKPEFNAGAPCLTCEHGQWDHHDERRGGYCKKDLPVGDYHTKCDCEKYIPSELFTAAIKKKLRPTPFRAECISCGHSQPWHHKPTTGSGQFPGNPPWPPAPCDYTERGQICRCPHFTSPELLTEAATKKPRQPLSSWEPCTSCYHMRCEHSDADKYHPVPFCTHLGIYGGCRCEGFTGSDLPLIEAATKKPKADPWAHADELVSECNCIRYRDSIRGGTCLICNHPKATHNLADESIPLRAGRPLDSCNGWMDKEAATKREAPVWADLADPCLNCGHGKARHDWGSGDYGSIKDRACWDLYYAEGQADVGAPYNYKFCKCPGYAAEDLPGLALETEAAIKKEKDPYLCLTCGHRSVCHKCFMDDSSCSIIDCTCRALAEPDLGLLTEAATKRPESRFAKKLQEKITVTAFDYDKFLDNEIAKATDTDPEFNDVATLEELARDIETMIRTAGPASIVQRAQDARHASADEIIAFAIALILPKLSDRYYDPAKQGGTDGPVWFHTEEALTPGSLENEFFVDQVGNELSMHLPD